MFVFEFDSPDKKIIFVNEDTVWKSMERIEKEWYPGILEEYNWSVKRVTDCIDKQITYVHER